MVKLKETKLIFLISQPRSGSTLTQKILGTHSKIYTRSEPWLMLHPSYSLKDSGVCAEYSFKYNKMALDSFLDDLPEGKSTYIKEIKKMYLNLYSYYLKGTSHEYFLDKTPRYYLIVDELMEIFPDAKYILLLRNPMAVLGSIINTWCKTNWYDLSDYKNDLIKAIDSFIDVIENKEKDFFVVHYESLVVDSEKQFTDIFEYIGLRYEEDVLKYDHHDDWIFGDLVNVNEKDTVDCDFVYGWQENLNDPQYWRVMHDYLHYIGEDKFCKLGYDFNENLSVLMESMPADTIEDIYEKTFPLFSFFGDMRECLIASQTKQGSIDRKDNELVQKDRIINKKNDEIIQKDNIILALKEKYHQQKIFEAEFYKVYSSNKVAILDFNLEHRSQSIQEKPRNLISRAAKLLRSSAAYHSIRGSLSSNKTILELYRFIMKLRSK